MLPPLKSALSCLSDKRGVPDKDGREETSWVLGVAPSMIVSMDLVDSPMDYHDSRGKGQGMLC